MKKTTIFRQLISNILLPVVIALIILGVLNYYNTKKILTEASNTKNIIIVDEITKILKIQDVSLRIIEEGLDERMKFLSKAFLEKYKDRSENIELQDFSKIQSEIGMIPAAEDIYLINRKGTIVKSTFEEDINLNLFEFGPDHEKFIKQVFNSEKFYSERLTIEANTRRLKKYSYQSTPDKKYVVEIGCYSQKADDILNYINKLIKDISQQHAGIVSVDLFIGADNPFSLSQEAVLKESHKEKLIKLFNNHDEITLKETNQGKTFYHDYIYINRSDAGLYKGSVVRIVSDRENDKKILQSELLKISLLFFITIVIIITLVYFRSKKIINPIKKLVNSTRNIIDGNLDTQVDVEGNNEIATLTKQFRVMTDSIKNHYELLEKKISRRTDELVSKTVTLEDKNRQLNSINKEQSITNRKLKKSETELKNALATRDKFFSIISHDLKNSFFSLLSMSEILIKNLENSQVNSDIKEYSHYIYYSSQQLFLVVDNLLNWANSERGTIKFRPQLLKIKPIIENIISFLKLNADEKNIQISSQVDEEFSVYADLNMVNTIFRNLVSNAIKFSEIDGKINIVTREEGRKIIVSIQDQGVGIRDEDINKLFKLEKHSEIGSSPEKGTGLGLTLVKEFVEKNGGQIHAESEYGKGTTFTFSLLKKKS